MIKKIVLAVGLLFVATNLWAAWVPGPSDVTNTWHNMGSTAPNPFSQYRATNEDEVCIFCHTPHGGTLNTPLWNRALPDQSVGNKFTHYTSATLSATIKNDAARLVNPESLLCMSCHDGTVAMNSIINISNRTIGGVPNGGSIGKLQTYYEWGFPGIGTVIGDAPNAAGYGTGSSRDLRDDHPISFSYTSVYGEPGYAAKLKVVGDAKLAGIRFFGATDRVECSSCHDPHVNGNAAGASAYLPFLITPNTASALCLACHIK